MEKYEELEIEVIEFESEDVITTSGEEDPDSIILTEELFS